MTTTADFIRTRAVDPEDLRRACEPLGLEFERSDELPGGEPHLGQQRAVDAVRFGLQIERDGYHIFVLGPLGSHRHGLAEELARERSRDRAQPNDWCYINNFADPERPGTLRFAAGQGAVFRDDMADLIDELRLAIPATFEGDDYRNQLRVIEEATQKAVEETWKSLDEEAAREGIGLLQTPTGYVLAPVSDGKVLSDEEFEALPEARREALQAAIERLSRALQSRIEEMPKLRKQHREHVRALNEEVVSHAVSVLINDVRKRYAEMPKVIAYLHQVERDIIQNAQQFRSTDGPQIPFVAQNITEMFGRYEVNLVVGNEPDAEAPIVYEPNPTHPNIIGKIEHRAEMGALVTDFRMVRAGALLQANGGYLILDIHRVLSQPFVWESLKQALFARHVRIETPGETLGFVMTTTLKPEPIPLDIKIILIGERRLYHLLGRYDHEFGELFKIAADMDDELDRSATNVEAYARLVADRVRALGLKPLERAAMARVIEQRARQAEDSERLSMHMRSLDDLLVQADHLAQQRDASAVGGDDVTTAIRQREYRLGRMQSKVIDAIRRDTLLIDTDGATVGQVNGLSVADLGEIRFGHPVRITATTQIGTGEVVDIEREVKLGGAIHSKGVLILSSALRSRYAQEAPLSLHASIVFEQSYGGVEGDSASVAELCSLVSSLSGVPVRQGIAITGSVNQLGRVQVIGGVNEKIEGFFDVCRVRGLDGSHGVIIPAGNVKHLMLREDVVAAVRDGQFCIYAVRDVDEAITILTGKDAGQRGETGDFPADSVNRLVEDKLRRYASLREAFASRGKANEPG